MASPVSSHWRKILLTLPVLVMGVSGCGSGYSGSEASLPVPYVSPPHSARGGIPADTTIVAIGDSVLISVWGYPEFTTNTVVRGNGAITIPLIGELKVAGVTKTAVTEQISSRLAQFVAGEPKLSVVVLTTVPRIYVLGAVQRQGSFPVTDAVPLLEAISLAGGVSKESDLRFVRITRNSPLRGEPMEIYVDVEDMINQGKVKDLPFIRQGDLVFVPLKEDLVLQVTTFVFNAIILLGIFGLNITR